MKSTLTTILCLFLFNTYGQDSKTTETAANAYSEAYRPKMIQTARMHMEYMDFGGKGNVLLHIQGVHNASALKDNPMYKENFTAWREMLSKASEYYRVYAPIYRGYGNSDKDGEDIYKVDNIAKDILAFMDKMKIESATLIGRTTAPQVMFYMAEHHPERVNAMIISSNSMYKSMPIKNDEIKDFMYFSTYTSMDLGNRAPDILMPTYDYEPLFYTDETKKIDIPLYWPYSEQMKISRMNLFIMNYLQPDHDFLPNEKARAYFNNLYKDKELQERIKAYYDENDNSQENMNALKRTFGDNLTLQNIDDINETDMMKKFEKADAIMMNYLISMSGKK